MKKKSFAIILIVVAAISSISLIFCLSYIGNVLIQHYKAKSIVSDLQGELNGEEYLFSTDDEVNPNISAYERYKDVYAKNNDLVGWVRIPDTNVNHPVMQSLYDPEHYLYRDFYKNSNSSGTPFAQANCAVGLCGNTIIYGHNMSNGTVFSELTNYTNQDYANKHPYIYFDTITEYGVYEVFAVCSIDATSTEFPFWEYLGSSEEEVLEYASICKQRSYITSDIMIEGTDKLVTLVTCEYSHENGRLLVVAKKVG